MNDTLLDPAAYLQRRVATFASIACPFFVVGLVLDVAVGSAEGEPLFSSTRVASLSVSLAAAVIWLLTRRGQRSARQSRALELLGMTVAIGVFATLPLYPPVPGLGGIMGLMTPIPMAAVVMLRAAVIPSPAWLSVLVALAWGGLMTWSAVLGWENVELAVPGQPAVAPHTFAFAHNAMATVTIAIVAGVVSRVVHGLQTRVREAMQLGQYTLESKIGEGGMGAVYLARHALLRRPTAVKLLPPEKSSERAIARFEREVQQTSRLTHPNTVAIFDFGRTREGIFYYAMEYLDGISIERLVRRIGALPADRTIHILVQAADALAEAHAAGLVHRDIKPDNVVLCRRGGIDDVVKVLDFGLVKDVEAPADARLSAADSLLGTPLYMAPEALTDPDTVDGRSDVYALGAVAYYALTGDAVFGGTLVEVLAHHLHTRPEPPSERRGEPVDVALEAIVMRCLEKRPGDRFQSAEALIESLQSCPAAADWTRHRAREWWDRHRWLVTENRDDSSQPSYLTLTRA